MAAQPRHYKLTDGYQRLIENSAEVDVLTNHWDPFFVSIAGKYGLSEQSLRDGFQSERG